MTSKTMCILSGASVSGVFTAVFTMASLRVCQLRYVYSRYKCREAWRRQSPC